MCRTERGVVSRTEVDNANAGMDEAKREWRTSNGRGRREGEGKGNADSKVDMNGAAFVTSRTCLIIKHGVPLLCRAREARDAA